MCLKRGRLCLWALELHIECLKVRREPELANSFSLGPAFQERFQPDAPLSPKASEYNDSPFYISKMCCQ